MSFTNFTTGRSHGFGVGGQESLTLPAKLVEARIPG